MGLERLAMYLDGHSSVWDTDELATLVEGVAEALGVDPSPVDPPAQRSLRIVADHLRAALVIAAAGIRPSASRHGYVLRKLIRRAVRHADLLTGRTDGLDAELVAATERVSAVMGQRWADVGDSPEGETARTTIEKEAAKFARTLEAGSDHLRELADHGTTFDGEVAFTLADTHGYPAELSAEEAERLGMTVDPDWSTRYDELREAQRARSRA
jgi:alanyl-tRNA synthetase